MEFLDISKKKDSRHFASYYSQSLLLADFKENHTLLFSGFKIPDKKSAKKENSSLFMNSILKNGKMRVENHTET